MEAQTSRIIAQSGTGSSEEGETIAQEAVNAACAITVFGLAACLPLDDQLFFSVCV